MLTKNIIGISESFNLKVISVSLILIAVFIGLKFWVGVYAHDEFGDRVIFLKHRPIWKTFFYSPRGMSDLKLTDLSAEQQYEQKLFDEFVLANQTIE